MHEVCGEAGRLRVVRVCGAAPPEAKSFSGYTDTYIWSRCSPTTRLRPSSHCSLLSSSGRPPAAADGGAMPSHATTPSCAAWSPRRAPMRSCSSMPVAASPRYSRLCHHRSGGTAGGVVPAAGVGTTGQPALPSAREASCTCRSTACEACFSSIGAPTASAIVALSPRARATPHRRAWSVLTAACTWRVSSEASSPAFRRGVSCWVRAPHSRRTASSTCTGAWRSAPMARSTSRPT